MEISIDIVYLFSDNSSYFFFDLILLLLMLENSCLAVWRWGFFFCQHHILALLSNSKSIGYAMSEGAHVASMINVPWYLLTSPCSVLEGSLLEELFAPSWSSSLSFWRKIYSLISFSSPREIVKRYFGIPENLRYT